MYRVVAHGVVVPRVVVPGVVVAGEVNPNLILIISINIKDN